MSSADYTKCSHCNTLLKKANDQPCPNCGRTEQTIYVEVEDRMNIRDDFVIGSTSGKTNRSTIHADSRNETDTVRLQKLIIDFIEHNSDDLVSYIDILVKNFNNQLNMNNIVCYRGIDVSGRNKLSSNKIGPSPNSSDGRYNIAGEKCIYLIDKIDFLFPELNSSSILVQRYHIPLRNFKIADLSTSNKSMNNNLALAFDMAESGRTSSGYLIEEQLQNSGKSKYLISQLLSSSFKKYGWEGLYIPGVHGNAGDYYHNLVIFGDLINNWKIWADGPCFPKSKI